MKNEYNKMKIQMEIKSEARNQKFETNSKLEFSNVQNEKIVSFGHLNFGDSDLFRISTFGFRIFKNSGSVLLVVVFAIALLTAFVAGMLQLNAEQIQLMRNEVYAAQAQAIAEAGMADAFAQLRSNSSWTSGYTNKSFGGGSYTVSVADSNVVSTGTSAQSFTSRVQADITIGGSSSPYIIRIDKLRINE